MRSFQTFHDSLTLLRRDAVHESYLVTEGHANESICEFDPLRLLPPADCYPGKRAAASTCVA